jgi:Tfp pilus assembly protein PilV
MKRPVLSDGEAGFALIETLVSAALLVVIAVALLTAAERAASTSLQSKGRSVAASIAEQDQERMRALPVTALSNYHPAARIVPAGSGSYTVTSRADWVRDSTGATQSCTNDGSQASYLKITSTVTSSVVGTATKPLTLSSLVAPPAGAFATNQGTLAVKVVDSRDQPVVGMSVSITGSRSLQDATNSSGCAVFAYIPASSYHILLNQSGWVDPTNATAVDKTQAVTSGNVTVATVQYDRAAKVGVKFQTWNGTGVVDSKGWGITATRVDTGGGTYFFEGGAALGQDQVDAVSLWPAQTGYKFSSGDCAGAEPSAATNIPNWWTTAPGNTNVLAPLPGTTDSVLRIRQPPLTMIVKNGATPLANATVVLTPADGACLKATLVTGADGKPTKAGGGAFDPGIPFGRYSVCVLGTVSGNLKKWTATNALNTTSATTNVVSGTSGASGSLDLSSATTVPSTTTC